MSTTIRDRAAPALRAAFPLTVPVMASFLVLGIAYGVLMHSIGLGAGWTLLMSAFVFAGAVQYVAITFFTAAFNPLYALAITLMVNARHVFYGLSMLERIKHTGRFKPYVIYTMCDATFSILCTTDPPEGVDRKYFMFFVAFLNHCYWIIGSLCGALIGNLIPFNTKGLDFALTAMFMVFFLNQWMKPENRLSSLIGVACSLICLILFGPNQFIIPAMALMLGVFALLSKKLAKGDT